MVTVMKQNNGSETMKQRICTGCLKPIRWYHYVRKRNVRGNKWTQSAYRCDYFHRKCWKPFIRGRDHFKKLLKDGKASATEQHEETRYDVKYDRENTTTHITHDFEITYKDEDGNEQTKTITAHNYKKDNDKITFTDYFENNKEPIYTMWLDDYQLLEIEIINTKVEYNTKKKQRTQIEITEKKLKELQNNDEVHDLEILDEYTIKVNKLVGREY